VVKAIAKEEMAHKIKIDMKKKSISRLQKPFSEEERK